MTNNSPSIESSSKQLVTDVYAALNARDADKLGSFFLADAALYSLNDSVPPMEGSEAIVEFFRDFFAKASTVNFELLSEPHGAGNLLMFEHIDHFELDGVRSDDQYVSVLLLIDGKIKKWLGYRQDPE